MASNGSSNLEKGNPTGDLQQSSASVTSLLKDQRPRRIKVRSGGSVTVLPGQARPPRPEELARVGARQCDSCQRVYTPQRAKWSKRFCRQRCAARDAEQSARLQTTSTPQNAVLSNKTKLRELSLATSTHSVPSDTGSLSRNQNTTNRLRSTFPNASIFEFTNNDFEPAATPLTGTIGKLVPMLASLPVSPIQTADTAPAVSRVKKSQSSTPGRVGVSRFSQRGTEEKIQTQKSLPQPKPSSLSSPRKYLEGKPDHVKRLVLEKPVVTWDTSEVASFFDSVGSDQLGSQLALLMLTEQIDGQCLLLLDTPEPWLQGFNNVSASTAKRLVKEVQIITDIQRENTLKKWHKNRQLQIMAVVNQLRAAG